MSRTILIVAGVFSGTSLLLVDSAVKGTALLMLAAALAIILRRDSAATRHLVWLLAIVAMLVVPILSAMLPQWRVLPEWASIPAATAVVAASPPSIARPAIGAMEEAQNEESDEAESPSASVYQPAVELPDLRPVLGTPQAVPVSTVWSWNWLNALPFVWAIGFCVPILRLMAARLMLWNTERQGAVIWSPRQPKKAAHDPIVTALEAASLQLGIGRPVTLLIHPDKTIPIVWGILRCRLLLPAVARHWSGEQLRSVLLHELAHIKRRDTMAQLLTQIACALHWFNPLVWFAAWRLGVERERACDDLVLASGVRPSAYAGHLLEAVTGLSPVRWTQSCGLAMARTSSLEGRLVAVLSGGRNRRGVTGILAAAAVVLAAAVAIPLAMLRAAEPDKPKTETAAANAEPKDAKSRPLFEDWKSSARRDGKIPGGRIGEMAASLKTLMDLNPGHEQSVKLEPVLKKCDASRDWTPAEAAALLDEIAGITPRAEWAMRANTEREIHPGKPLPEELAKAPWGKPAENGLRTAWLLEPRAETQALDSVMKSRVLFHNAGKDPVCFATENWIQSGGHKAKDAGGKDISVWAVSRMGIRLRMVFRLAPGEYAEVEGHGLGVGSHETASEKSIYRVGCWIEAKLNDEVTFTPANVLVTFQTWRDNEGLKDSVTVWKEMIAARVMQESPMPAAAADREQLLRRVIKDFFGTDPSAGEIAAFVTDNAPDALSRLIKSLQVRAAAMHFAGELSGGETKFRVTAAVPKKEEPKQGAKLQLATEEKLEWGEPMNGLRMALAWPPTLGEPAAGDVPDLFLAVQNVSAAPVRLCTTAEAPIQRRLTFATDGVLQGRIVSSEPNGADVTLQPREAVFLRLFTEDAKNTERAPHGSMLAATVRQSPKFTLRADIEIAKAPAGAWTGKLVTPETRAGIGAEAPKNRKAQELFKVWLRHARVNGKIPGGCIARLGDRVKEFVRGNLADKAGEPHAKRMEPLVSRLDGARDWQPAEASALLTDIAAVSDSPLSVMLEETAGGTIQYGPSLKKDLENAPWGEALPNGLRVACLLEPRAAAHRLGTPLKMRILVHNAGKETVVFRSRTWHHIEPTARNAKGMEIEMESVTRYTLPPLVAYRLVPGGFVELASPGLGLGKYGFHDFKQADIASWIGAKDGDEVTLTPGPVPLSDWNEASVLNGEPRWWLDFLTARLNLATPLPADAAERAELIQRTVRDIFYTDATAEEIATFVADREPNALDTLAKRLSQRAGLTPFTGSLTSGTTKFRVLPADPGGAKPVAKPAATSAPPAAPAPAEKPKTSDAGRQGAVKVDLPANGEPATDPAKTGVPAPKNKEAQALFKMCSESRRADGKIPGALIGRLAASVTTFVKNNPTWETTPQLVKMLPRLDATRDWSQQNAVALLDEVAAVQATPIGMALDREYERTIQTAMPLPVELADAPWGEALPNGLRLAYLLEPRLAEHRLNTPLKGRILIHNAGKQPVVFRARTWHQAGHQATDAKGAEINIVSTEWTTLGRLVPFRLAPGEFVEVKTAGIGVGADRNVEDWQSTRVGSWVEAKEGDEVTVTTTPVPLSDWNEEPTLDGEPRWWLDHITARLSRHLPLPAEAEARKLLLDRVAMELFGTPVSAEINAAFVADREPTALDSLAKRLFHRPGLHAWAGPLQSGPTKFRVLPADPDAAKRPRVASHPGWYTLGELVRLDVSRRPVGERLVNEASILFFSSDPKADAPGKPHPLKLPDGYNTWAVAWLRGGTVLWVQQKGSLRSYDFTNPAQVKETTLEEPANFDKVPEPILNALRAAFDVPGAPKQESAAPKKEAQR